MKGIRLLQNGAFSLTPMLLLALGIGQTATTPAQPAPSGRCLIIGGGPNPKNNQIAIESNVRYFSKVLPTSTSLRVLFTDGNLESENILCQGADKKQYYKKTSLTKIDGSTEFATVKSEISAMAASAKEQPKVPAMIYLTGHGSGDKQGNYLNNWMDLWNRGRLTVKDLSASIAEFPKETPLTFIMVQCFSGGFGAVLFKDGDLAGELVDQNVCGFFAAISQRVAAGCTPEINEAEYRDSTSYFVAALTGQDRMGRPVFGADYDKNGVVGMNEAFCYELIHDDSIDTPTCTSDYFLRRFVTTPEEECFNNKYNEILKWASPAQKAALEALSEKLKFSGENRAMDAYKEFLGMNILNLDERPTHVLRYVRLIKSVVLAHNLAGMKDNNLKKRYANLIKLESANPFRK